MNNRNEIKQAIENNNKTKNSQFLAVGVSCFVAATTMLVANSTGGQVAFPNLTEMATNIGLTNLNGVVATVTTTLASLACMTRAMKSTSASEDDVDKVIQAKNNISNVLKNLRSHEKTSGSKLGM